MRININHSCERQAQWVLGGTGVFLESIRWFAAGKTTIQLLCSPPAVLADVLSKPASPRPLKNRLYVKTSSLGLEVHMESSGRAPRENVLRGIF